MRPVAAGEHLSTDGAYREPSPDRTHRHADVYVNQDTDTDIKDGL